MKGNRHNLVLNLKVSVIKKAIGLEIAHLSELIEEVEKFTKHADKHRDARIRKYFTKNGTLAAIKLQEKLDRLVYWSGFMSCYPPELIVTINESDARLFNISGNNL